MRGLATDHLYRERWERYHTADGSVYDSREINWRLVPWSRLTRIEMRIRDRVISEDCREKPSFVGFIRFRWSGSVTKTRCFRTREGFDHAMKAKQKLTERKPINQWAIGWTDGDRAYLNVVDFKTAELLPPRIEPLENYAEHLHPSLWDRCCPRVRNKLAVNEWRSKVMV